MVFSSTAAVWLHDASGLTHLGMGAYSIIGDTTKPQSCIVLYFSRPWSQQDVQLCTVDDSGKLASAHAEALGARYLAEAVAKNATTMPAACKHITLICDASAWIDTARNTATDDRLMAACRDDVLASIAATRKPVFFRRRPRAYVHGADLLSRLDVPAFLAHLNKHGFSNVSQIN